MQRLLKTLLKMVLYIIGLILLFAIGVIIFINTSPQFGGSPNAESQSIIDQSPNYENGVFQNLIETKMDMSFSSMMGTMGEYLSGKNQKSPPQPLPVAFDQTQEEIDTAVYVTWFGHSAVLLEIEDKKILLDPMLGDAAAPVSFMTKRFNYTSPIKLSSITDIDAVLISHDHYDHLDYPTISALKDKVGHFYTPLAVGAHLESWGVDANRITELDWWQSGQFGDLTFTCTPSRHFSGRGVTDRNSTQWGSWVIEGKKSKIYFSGDSGYGPHFKEIGDRFGPFDFVMMECGQYHKNWAAIHMMPEETVQAGRDVKTEKLMPIHWGAFNLSLHSWTDPVVRAQKAAESTDVQFVTPIIGDRFNIYGALPQTKWWEAINRP
ncbi:MAG: MBL fold metallo-hydrolase [Cyclobacteriaceae bacterium]